MLKKLKKNKGFTLVEVIVVAVIVAVLALVAIQLYQGYVRESRKNTAENLAASAAGFLQSVYNVNNNVNDCTPNPLTSATSTGWTVNLSNNNTVVFKAPADGNVSYTSGSPYTVTATVKGVSSQGTYNYR